MLVNNSLINPKSIAVIGGSNNLHKPGGKIIENLLKGGFNGDVYAVNQKEEQVQGIPCYQKTSDLPEVEMAVIAIPARFCPEVAEELAYHKNTRAFIILSSGFSEVGEEGARMEKRIVDVVNEVKGSLIGPNCVGVVNQNYKSIFTSPVPVLDPKGVDFVSASGGTAIFILESALPKGLRFNSMFSVGNSAQIGVEDVVEYMDETFEKENSSRIKILYLETIHDPDKLLKHASSLIRKGCKIAAIKSGGSEAGIRAASSHTGALANSDLAVDALFRKAGIVRCHGREELTTVASVFTQKEIKGKNIAIITHAGGPAVMLTDALATGGLNIPEIGGKDAKAIRDNLEPGAAVSNPVDLLATGTPSQLAYVIDYCENNLPSVDAMMIIFGSTGLQEVYDAYEVLDKKMHECKKPIYPILPSISSAKKEVEYFLSKGHVNFPDEVLLGNAVSKTHNTPYPAHEELYKELVDIERIREIIEKSKTGFLDQGHVQAIMKASKIPMVKERVVKSRKVAVAVAEELGYPLALKAVGPVHKTDVGGVVLNVKTKAHLLSEFRRIKKIKGCKAVLIQPMISGTELFIGAKYEQDFGHVVLCGLGGIFIEVLKDVSSGLAPLNHEEALSMIRSTKSYKLIQGTRGQVGVSEEKFADIIVKLSTMLRFATEIKEIDINPLIGKNENIFAVDARIYIEK